MYFLGSYIFFSRSSYELILSDITSTTFVGLVQVSKKEADLAKESFCRETPASSSSPLSGQNGSQQLCEVWGE